MQTIVEYASTAYRDEPVEFLRTIFPQQGQKIHYQCKHCGTKIWPYSSEALEDFATYHEQCATN